MEAAAQPGGTFHIILYRWNKGAFMAIELI
jgi:hypothetical protein